MKLLVNTTALPFMLALSILSACGGSGGGGTPDTVSGTQGSIDTSEIDDGSTSTSPSMPLADPLLAGDGEASPVDSESDSPAQPTDSTLGAGGSESNPAPGDDGNDIADSDSTDVADTGDGESDPAPGDNGNDVADSDPTDVADTGGSDSGTSGENSEDGNDESLPSDETAQDGNETDPDLPSDQPAPGDELVFLPQLAEGSNAERLMSALTTALTTTLSTLGDKLSSGIALTDQELQCLGNFDQALGNAPLALNCDTPLASPVRIVRIASGALYSTAACRLSLSEGRTDACVMRNAVIYVFPQFATSSEGRPTPQPGTDVILSYSADERRLILTNDGDVFGFGPFECDVSFETETVSSGSGVTDCETHLEATADKLTELQAEGQGTL